MKILYINYYLNECCSQVYLAMKQEFLILVLLSVLKQFSCGCTESYATFCDSLADYQNFKNRKLPDVIIESRFSENPKRKSLDLSLFQYDVMSLTVVSQVNAVVPKEDCFPGSALKFLNLYDNDIEILQRNSFPLLAAIYKLSLCKNRIKYIETETFAGCQPEIIDLSHNQIEIIESYTFTSKSSENKTRVIILENNKLVTVDRYSFPPTLTFLNLNSNKLSFMEPELIAGLVNLEELILSRNIFSHVPNITSLTKLKELDLSYNRINRIGAESFGVKKKLLALYLSHNKISQVNNDSFHGLKSIGRLDLSYNQIKNIGFLNPFLSNYWSLEVSLAFNHLYDVDFGINLEDQKHGVTLHLYGNPWRCSDWISIERYLNKAHIGRDDCDVKFFNGGLTPFCHCSSDIRSFFPGHSQKNNHDFLPSERSAVYEFLKVVTKTKYFLECGFSDRPSFPWLQGAGLLCLEEFKIN